MPLRFHSQLMCICVTCASHFGVAADTANTDDHAGSEISDVLVTAPLTGSARFSTSLGKDELQSLNAATSDTASLLKNIPGISLYGAGGVSSLPAIHGLADDRLRIRLDGMDLISACGNHMNPPLSYTDPSAVDSVEVFAGITPVSLGGDSIGGTILVDSLPAEFAPDAKHLLTEADLGIFYGSDAYRRSANFGGTIASDRLSLRYSGAFAKADNYKAGKNFKPAGIAADGRRWLDGDEVGSTAYESWNHKVGLAMKFDEQLFDLEIGYQHIPYQGFPNQRMDMLENDSTQVVLRHTADYAQGTVDSRLYYEKTRHKMNFGDDKQFWYGDAPGMPMETRGENTGGAVTIMHNLSAKNTLRSGIEFQVYKLDDWWPSSGSGMMMAPNTFWNIRHGERNRFALFGEWQSNWNNRWLTIVGVRHETVKSGAGNIQGYSAIYLADASAFNSVSHSKRDNNWDFTAQTRLTPDENQTYEAGIARKTRSPNLYERYAWSTVGMAMRMVNLAGDGNGYVGNLALAPEKAYTLSISADWHDSNREHWAIVIAPFYTLLEDFIDASPCTTMMCNVSNAMPGFRYLTFANQDARLYGVDISGFLHLWHTRRLGSLQAKLVINYLNGENRDTGDNLYNIMPLNSTLTLEQTRENWSNSIEWQLVSAKDNVSEVRNEIATAGYGLLNLRSSFTWQDFRLDLGMENLLDKGYSLPLGGAYLGQGMTMSPAGLPWGIAVPGPGRSLYGGVTYSF